MKKKLNHSAAFLVVFLLLSIASQAQQLVNFSQYVFNPVFINPAYSGYKEDSYVQSFYRNQWAGVEGAPRSFGLAFDSFWETYGLGYGLVFRSDQIGPHITFSAYANVSYHLQLSKSQFLSFGASFGYSDWRLDESILEPAVKDDPILGVGKNRIAYPDLKLGLFYYSDYYFFSISFDNTLSGFLGYDYGDVIFRPGLHMNISSGFLFELSEYHLIKTSMMFREDFRSAANIEISSSWLYRKMIGLGLGYRSRLDYAQRSLFSPLGNQVAMILYFEMIINDQLRLGYTYDHGLKNIIGSFQTNELNLSYRFGANRRRIISPRYF